MTAARNAVPFAPLGYLFHAPSFSFEGDSSIITPKPLSAVLLAKCDAEVTATLNAS